MKLTVCSAVVLAALVAGCGSGGNQQPQSSSGANRPSQGFQGKGGTAGRTGPPESYTQADRATATESYDYILRFRRDQRPYAYEQCRRCELKGTP